VSSRGKHRSWQRIRSDRGVSEIAQFVPVLYVLFLVILMPLLDVVNVFVGGAVQYLATNDIAAKASSQPDYATTLNTMVNEAYQFQSNGLAKFVNLAPDGGYTGCGADLYIVGTNVQTGAITTSTANQTLTQAVDTTQNMYEASVKTTYDISPLVSFAAIPGLNTVPGLGMPVTLNCTANRPIEHPGGLEITPTGSVGNVVTPFNRLVASTSSSPAAGLGAAWRNPAIYQTIQQAGLTVVTTNVFTVQASAGSPVSSGVTIAANQKFYIDTQAVGQWNIAPEFSYGALTDANGDAYNGPQPGLVFPDLPASGLCGQVGTGTPFLVGDSQLNYAPNGVGLLTMMTNDQTGCYSDNLGAQIVRVIVVQ
jgi:hypothetical protein